MLTRIQFTQNNTAESIKVVFTLVYVVLFCTNVQMCFEVNGRWHQCDFMLGAELACMFFVSNLSECPLASISSGLHQNN